MTAAAVEPRDRLAGVDMLRGLIMVIMVLDHTRDFVQANAQAFDPTDPTKATALLFATRWITHLCAPTFFFLAGTGAWLARGRGQSTAELSRFLLTRGAWLAVLDMTVVHVGVTFLPDFRFQILTTIWALGCAMVALSALVWLPWGAVTAIGAAIVLLHNTLDGVQAASLGSAGWLWTVLHAPGLVPVGPAVGTPPEPAVRVVFAYPILPWIGVMSLGYAFGRVLELDPARRRRIVVRLGALATVAFVALRWANVYGDPRPWRHLGDAAHTTMSFLQLQKYPPSLLFVLATMGPSLLLLAAFLDRRPTGVLGALATFGRVPLFYYLVQFPLAHALGLAASAIAGQPTAWAFGLPGGGPPHGFGLGLVYALWIVAVVLLFPLCVWYAGAKARHPRGALRYL